VGRAPAVKRFLREERTVPIKVVIAKPGLDGHDRGAKVVARALRDAGMEVVYTGIFQTPESILRAVIEEDAAVLGLSSLSGAHMEYAEDLCEMLRENGMGDVLFLVGGTIPDEDAERLKSVGVTEVFGPGTPTGTITEYIRRNVRGALRGDAAGPAAADVVEDVHDHPH
jgi:methylmalonyl-CoA mutase C-terminal domain/subunit